MEQLRKRIREAGESGSFSGVVLVQHGGELIRYGHTGEEEGVSCRLYHYPKENIYVAILGNQSWRAGQLGWDIRNTIMEITA
jgi:hypothetical protein